LKGREREREFFILPGDLKAEAVVIIDSEVSKGCKVLTPTAPPQAPTQS
jgi:hypothetical protein